jgi:hypothetical protein
MDEGVLTHTIAYVTNLWFCVKKIIHGIVFTYCYFQCIHIYILKVWNQYNEWKKPKNTLKALELVFLNNKRLVNGFEFFFKWYFLANFLWVHSQI